MIMGLKSQTKSAYFENLDALRFLAFFSVFISHCHNFFNYQFSNKITDLIYKHYFLNGDLGVGFFFVLSGFLITYLLMTENDRNGNIQLWHFYMRRILRIWPVYFLVVLIGFVIGLTNSAPYKSQPSQIVWYLAFLANYDLIQNGMTNSILSVLWSVAVEEQFYLVWPLLIIFFSRKALPILCCGIIITSICFRMHHQGLLNYSTFEVMSYLAMGGLLSYYTFMSSPFVNFFKSISKTKIALVYFLLFLFIPMRGLMPIYPSIFTVYYTFEPILFSCFFAFIILEQNYAEHSLFKFGKIQAFGRLGRISYGLYAYHVIFLAFTSWLFSYFNGLPGDLFLYIIKVVLSFFFTVAFSSLSFKYFESKFLALKKYFSANDSQPVKLIL